MSQNGQTHFKNLKIFKVSEHFGTLCLNGLNDKILISKKCHNNCNYVFKDDVGFESYFPKVVHDAFL